MRIYLSLLLVISCSISFSQSLQETQKPDSRPRNPVQIEAIPFWTDSTAVSTLIIFYAIDPSFLCFVKKDDPNNLVYEAHGEFGVEIFDSTNTAIAREFRPLQIQRLTQPSEERGLPQSLQGFFIFHVQKGTYRLMVETKDKESGNIYTDRSIVVHVRPLSFSGLNVSPLLFVDTASTIQSASEARSFTPKNAGGNILIGQTGSCLMQIFSPDTISDFSCSWKITPSLIESSTFIQEFSGDQFSQVHGTLVPSEEEKQTSLTIQPGSPQSRFIFFQLPFHQLEAGMYRLSLLLTQGKLKTETVVSFRVIWPHQPRSLALSRLSVEALRHIATETEINEMLPISSPSGKKAFNLFWKKRNLDTASAYNPAKAEYYRRVDESIKRFSTDEEERDGFRTDRGRILILFGTPSEINHVLKPDSPPAEIWSYEKIKRRFTFTDQKRNGNYILIKAEKY